MSKIAKDEATDAATDAPSAASTKPKTRAMSPDSMELDREALLARLRNLDPRTKTRPGYKTALSLLNSKFRKASLGARLAVLQSAAFMIEVLEKLPL